MPFDLAQRIQQWLERLSKRLADPGRSADGSTDASVQITQNAGNGSTQIGQANNVTIHNAPDPRQIEAEKAEKARRQYLEALSAYCQALPLAALDDAEAEGEIRLDDVYIALNVLDRTPGDEMGGKRGGDRQTAAAWDTFLQTPRLALLGDPGSGKSTFVRMALALQARALLQGQPLPGMEADLIPILVTLRDLIGALETMAASTLSAERRKASLLALFRKQIEADTQMDGLYPAPGYTPLLLEALHQGQVILALDGLDELPERLRPLAQELFTALLSSCRPRRVALTCRVRSYTDSARRSDFTDYLLADLSEEQIGDFCRAWYRTRLGRRDPEAARQRGEGLAEAALEDKLRSLAENPMLLTAMAVVHFKQTRLPHERVRLYSKVVEILVEGWQRHKGLAMSAELEHLLADVKQVRAILERLAYQAHQVEKEQSQDQRVEQSADLPGPAARELLAVEFLERNYNLAAEFLEYVDQRAGLLLGRGGAPGCPSSYAFAHRTFQEYLAGCYLVNLRRPEKEIEKLAGESEFWSLAVQLGAEELFYNGLSRNRVDMLDLAEGLYPKALSDVTQRRTALWAGKMLATAAVTNLADQHCPGLKENLRRALVNLLRSDLPAIERADAGRALARLGDPRVEVMRAGAMSFCRIAGGKFLLGSPEGEGDDDEHPQHELALPGFWLGRYPVTNAQYAEFVQAGGYQNPAYWPEARQAKVWRDGKIHLEWASEIREAPSDFGEPFILSNHPVVGVTWYEALAFCRWLNEELLKQARRGEAEGEMLAEIAAGRLAVTLPSEAEWECAAKGGQERPYPWDGNFDANRANTAETGIGTSSAVGCFAGGASRDGLLEMSGNVWEWTRSVKESYPYRPDDGREDLQGGNARVRRGGSFVNESGFARSSYRLFNLPDLRFGWYVGFRCCLAPCR